MTGDGRAVATGVREVEKATSAREAASALAIQRSTRRRRAPPELTSPRDPVPLSPICALRTSSNPIPSPTRQESLIIRGCFNENRWVDETPSRVTSTRTRHASRRRARTLAVRWLVEFARARREKTLSQRLADELIDRQQQQGNAFKR